jgi:hypothetical protein
MTAPRPLDPTDLDDHPQLAPLAIVQAALAVASSALFSAHPHLAGDDVDSTAEHLATIILRAADTLSAAIAAYRSLLQHPDPQPPF